MYIDIRAIVVILLIAFANPKGPTPVAGNSDQLQNFHSAVEDVKKQLEELKSALSIDDETLLRQRRRSIDDMLARFQGSDTNQENRDSDDQGSDIGMTAKIEDNDSRCIAKDFCSKKIVQKEKIKSDPCKEKPCDGKKRRTKIGFSDDNMRYSPRMQSNPNSVNNMGGGSCNSDSDSDDSDDDFDSNDNRPVCKGNYCGAYRGGKNSLDDMDTQSRIVPASNLQNFNLQNMNSNLRKDKDRFMFDNKKRNNDVDMELDDEPLSEVDNDIGYENAINSINFPVLATDEYNGDNNDLSHEANYKLSKLEQDNSEKRKSAKINWRAPLRVPVLKRSSDFNAMNEIKLKTSHRLMRKGLGASLPSSALVDTHSNVMVDNMLKKMEQGVRTEYKSRDDDKYTTVPETIDADAYADIMGTRLKRLPKKKQQQLGADSIDDLGTSMGSALGSSLGSNLGNNFDSNLGSDMGSLNTQTDDLLAETSPNYALYTTPISRGKRVLGSDTMNLPMMDDDDKKDDANKNDLNNMDNKIDINSYPRMAEDGFDLDEKEVDDNLMNDFNFGAKTVQKRSQDMKEKEVETDFLNVFDYSDKNLDKGSEDMDGNVNDALVNDYDYSDKTLEKRSPDLDENEVDDDLLTDLDYADKTLQKRSPDLESKEVGDYDLMNDFNFGDKTVKKRDEELDSSKAVDYDLPNDYDYSDKTLEKRSQDINTATLPDLSKDFTMNEPNPQKEKRRVKRIGVLDHEGNVRVEEVDSDLFPQSSQEPLANQRFKRSLTSQTTPRTVATPSNHNDLVNTSSQLSNKTSKLEGRKRRKSSHRISKRSAQLIDEINDNNSENFNIGSLLSRKQPAAVGDVVNGQAYGGGEDLDLSGGDYLELADRNKRNNAKKGDFDFETVTRDFGHEKFDNLKQKQPEAAKFEGLKFDNMWYDISPPNTKYIRKPMRTRSRSSKSSSSAHPPVDVLDTTTSASASAYNKYMNEAYMHAPKEHLNRYVKLRPGHEDNNNTDQENNGATPNVDKKILQALRNEILNSPAFKNLETYINQVSNNQTGNNQPSNGEPRGDQPSNDAPTNNQPANNQVNINKLNNQQNNNQPINNQQNNQPNNNNINNQPNNNQATNNNTFYQRNECDDLTLPGSDRNKSYTLANRTSANMCDGYSSDTADDNNNISNNINVDNNMKLNISINASVSSDNKPPKRFYGDGLINVRPGYAEERKTRRSAARTIRQSRPMPGYDLYQPDDDLEDMFPLDKVVTGKLPSQVVKSLFGVVQSNPNLESLWPCLQNNMPATRQQVQNFYSIRNEENESEMHRTEQMLQKAMENINDIIDQQVRSRTCVPLRPDLEKFYEQILQTFAEQDKNREKRAKRDVHRAVSLDFSKELRGLNSNKVDEVHNVVKRLLKQYSEMTKADQESAINSRDDLLMNLVYLRRLKASQDTVRERRKREIVNEQHLNLDENDSILVKRMESDYSHEFLKLIKTSEIFREAATEQE